MKNTKEKIELFLENLFLKNLNINFKNNPELKKVHFFSNKLNIPIREVLVIFNQIQEEFNIMIPENDVILGKFSTFENISSIIENCILKNKNVSSNVHYLTDSN